MLNGKPPLVNASTKDIVTFLKDVQLALGLSQQQMDTVILLLMKAEAGVLRFSLGNVDINFSSRHSEDLESEIIVEMCTNQKNYSNTMSYKIPRAYMRSVKKKSFICRITVRRETGECVMTKCLDCGVEEGELHQQGCDWETCPKCLGQLISCCCSDEEVESKGYRIPWVRIPNLCVLCGKQEPEDFYVPDEEWKKFVPPNLKKEILCKPCYIRLKGLFPNGWRKAR